MSNETAAVQSAVNRASQTGSVAYLPSGMYRLTAPITASAGVTIKGDPPVMSGGVPSGGTWFHIDHSGVGFDLNNSAGYFSDVQMLDFGLYRNQPDPSVGWQPANHDYDISIFGLTDINITGLTLLNPTRGIKQAGGGGRINIDNIRMQALVQGIVIDEAYDVCRISNIHNWVFWKDHPDVHRWMLGNMKGISLGRCDNPMLSNIFTIFAQTGLHFYQNIYGCTSKIHLANADFDAGINGVWVDSTVTNGVSGQFANVTHQGFDGSDNSIGLLVAGTSSNLSFSSIKTMFCGANGLRVDGSGNKIAVADATVLYYDQGRKGFPGVEVAANNTMSFAQRPFIATNGAGPQYGGSGEIRVAVSEKVN